VQALNVVSFMNMLHLIDKNPYPIIDLLRLMNDLLSAPS
jgi:hypothetical protein